MNSMNNYYLTQPLEVDKKHHNNNNISYYIETNDNSYLLKPGVNYIGRDESCHIQINDASLSRKHAMIEITSDGSVFIQDLCSVNKTFRNDCQLRKSVMYELTNGNRVNFGNITAKFIEIINSPEFIERIESDNSDLFSNDSCNFENQVLSQSENDTNPTELTSINRSNDSQLDDTEILEENSVTKDKTPELIIKSNEKKGNNRNFYVTSTPSNRNRQQNNGIIEINSKKTELQSVLDNLLLNTEMGVFNDSEIKLNDEKSEENCFENSIRIESLHCESVGNELRHGRSSVDIFNNSQSTTDDEVLSETDFEDDDVKCQENKYNNAVNLSKSEQELCTIDLSLENDQENSNKPKKLPMIEKVKNLTNFESSAILSDIGNKRLSESDGTIDNPIVTMDKYHSIENQTPDEFENFDNLPTQKLGNEIIDYQVTATQIVKEADKTSDNYSYSQAIYSQIATQLLSDQQKPEKTLYKLELELSSKLANEIIATQIVKEVDKISDDNNNNSYYHSNQPLLGQSTPENPPLNLDLKLAKEIITTQIIKETDKVSENNNSFLHSNQPLLCLSKPENPPLNLDLKLANEIITTQIIKETDKVSENNNSFLHSNQPLLYQSKPENPPLNLDLKLANEIITTQIIMETDKTIKNNNSFSNTNESFPDSLKPSPIPLLSVPAQNQSKQIVTTSTSTNKKSKVRKTPTHKKIEKEITEKIVTNKAEAKQKSPLTDTKENKSEINTKLSNFHRKLNNNTNNIINNNPMDIFEFCCDSDDFMDSNKINIVTNPKVKAKKVLKERNIELTKENDEKNSKKINFRNSENALLNAVVVLSDVGKTTNQTNQIGRKRKSQKTNSDLNPVDIDEDARGNQSRGFNTTIPKDLTVINNTKIGEKLEGNNSSSKTAKNIKEKKSKKKIDKNNENSEKDKNEIKIMEADGNITKKVIATGKITCRKKSIFEEGSPETILKEETKSITIMEAATDSSTSKRKRGRPRRNTSETITGTTSNIRITGSKRKKPVTDEIDIGKCVKTEELIEKIKFQSDSCEQPTARKRVRRSTRGRKSNVVVDRITIDESHYPSVMFTGLSEPKNEQIIRALGGEVIDDVFQVDCLVTDKIRRTVKFLCCLARGVPIVSPNWLVSSQHSKRFIDTRPYIVTNNAESFNINLETSIELASNYQQTTGGILAHYKCIIYIAGATKPDSSQLEQIITCAGGKMLSIQDVDFYEHLNDVESKHICVADPDVMKTDNQDLLERFRVLKNRNIDILSVEFILTMIMEQKWPSQQNYRLEFVN